MEICMEAEETLQQMQYIFSKAKVLFIQAETANVFLDITENSDFYVSLSGRYKSEEEKPYFVCLNEFDILNISVNGVKDTFSNAEMQLRIYLPKRLYQMLSIQTKNGNIFVSEKIQIRNLQIKTIEGNITLKTSASTVAAKSFKGKINYELFAKEDTTVYLTSGTGDVKIGVENVKNLFLFSNTVTGKIQNLFENERNDSKSVSKNVSKGVQAIISINTKEGNVLIFRRDR